MVTVDYLIVGDGYAAMFMAHQLIKHKKSFLLFSEGKESASQISAGIINPVVLKKFTTFWLASEQIEALHDSLSEIESYTGKNCLINEPVHRIFHDENERNLWEKKAATPELGRFLDSQLSSVEGVTNPYGTGKVKQSARLNVTSFFEDMFSYLESNGNLKREKFQYEDLNTEKNIYRDIYYNKIIFCEGIGVQFNPYFSWIPVHPNKGHHLSVKPYVPVTHRLTLKKKHFLFPKEDGTWYYGGTYDREQLHLEIDEKAVEQLNNGLREFYPRDFAIEEIRFGFRPTVKDRRPILGAHHQFKNLYVFNGLGARGILSGNFFAAALYRHIENLEPLHPEVDVARFRG